MSSSSPAPSSRPPDGRITPAPTPRFAQIIRAVSELQAFGDDDTIASALELMTLKVELHRAGQRLSGEPSSQ